MCEISYLNDFAGLRAVTFTAFPGPVTQQMLREPPPGSKGPGCLQPEQEPALPKSQRVLTRHEAAAQYLLPSPGPDRRQSSAQQKRGAGPLEIDSLFQVLFIIPSTDTDMCLLKGDTVPLTLTLSALVIWDASPGSSEVTFRGEGRDCIYLWGSWKFLTSHASPIIHMLHGTKLALLMQQHHIKKFDFLLWQQACPL